MTLVIELQWKRARLFIGRDSGKKKEEKKKKKKRRIPVVARERVRVLKNVMAIRRRLRAHALPRQLEARAC